MHSPADLGCCDSHRGHLRSQLSAESYQKPIQQIASDSHSSHEVLENNQDCFSQESLGYFRCMLRNRFGLPSVEKSKTHAGVLYIGGLLPPPCSNIKGEKTPSIGIIGENTPLLLERRGGRRPLIIWACASPAVFCQTALRRTSVNID